MLLLADYDFYKFTYCGALITEDAWYAAIREASAFVDDLTHGRLSRVPEQDTPEEAKAAACAVAEVIAQDNAAEEQRTAGVASETVGSHSVNYTAADVRLTEKRRKMYNAAGLYLPLSHPLRYAGVDRC